MPAHACLHTTPLAIPVCNLMNNVLNKERYPKNGKIVM